ncbi:unnamed protein product, partial [Allacma fusca]
FSSLLAVEVELRNNDVVDIEILFPNKDVRKTEEQKEKSARLISFLDRLLNRNQGNSNSGGSSGTSNNNNNNNNRLGSNTDSTTRRSGLGSLIFVPDVSKGVDTILGGVASANLEQIISGSFIFTPSRVQNVANNVINRVFGGPSISTINNQNNNNNNNYNNNNSNRNVISSSSNNNVNKNPPNNVITGSLVDAVNQIRKNDSLINTNPLLRVTTTTASSGGWFSGLWGRQGESDGQGSNPGKKNSKTAANPGSGT